MADMSGQEIFRDEICSGDDGKLPSHPRERRHGLFEVVSLVQRGELHADARLAFRHDRVAEPDHVDALVEQAVAPSRAASFSS